MEKALILVKSKSQANNELFNKIKNLKGVVEVNMIYGPYDIYAICENETTMGIKQLVVNLRNLPGVISTLTCLISE
jgi:nitrate reductase NapAB chaperone NapD